MTERSLGNLVEAIKRNPKARFVVVVPTHQHRKALFTQLLDLLRAHDSLSVERWSAGAWELAVKGAGNEATVRVVIPNSPLIARGVDRVVLDEVVNDPKDVWLQGVVMSRLAPGGRVETVL